MPVAGIEVEMVPMVDGGGGGGGSRTGDHEGDGDTDSDGVESGGSIAEVGREEGPHRIGIPVLITASPHMYVFCL